MIDVRARISKGVNLVRLKLEARRAVRPAVVLLVSVASGFAGLAYILLNVSDSALTRTYQVRFAVDDARAVVPGLNKVEFKGIEVGTITRSDLTATGPVLTVKIQAKYGRIYRNARAALRPATPLQDMRLNIVERGTPSGGDAGLEPPIAASRTETSVNVADVLNVFEPSVRSRMRWLLDNLGNGLGRRGAALREAFVTAVPFIRVGARITDQLGRRQNATRRLVHNAGLLMTELGRRQLELRTMLNDGATTLETLQRSSRPLDETLRRLPSTLREADSSFASLRAVLGDVDGAIRALYPAADELPPSLRAVRDLSASAAPAVRALQRPVRRLVSFARQVRPLAANLSTAFSALLPQRATIDKVTRRVAGCKAAIQGFFQWDASMSKFGDLRGVVPRGNLSLDLAANGAVRDPLAVAPKNCTPGAPIGGRPATKKDMH